MPRPTSMIERARETFLRRTLVGPLAIPLGDVMRMIREIREKEEAKSAKGPKRDRVYSPEAIRMLGWRVVDVGWTHRVEPAE